jgi:hypothetical protein
MRTTAWIRRGAGAALAALTAAAVLTASPDPAPAADCPPSTTVTTGNGPTTTGPHTSTTKPNTPTTKPTNTTATTPTSLTTTTRKPRVTTTTVPVTTTNPNQRTTTTPKPPGIAGGPSRSALIVHVRPADPCPPPSTTSTTAPGPGLHPDPPSVPPGGHLKLVGHGCTPGSGVAVSVGAHPVGSATADDSGDFATPVDVPVLSPGEYQLQAACGPVLTTPLDVVLATSIQQGGTALALLSFFVLFSALLLRRRWF